jgi:hypothetical protein
MFSHEKPQDNILQHWKTIFKYLCEKFDKLCLEENQIFVEEMAKCKPEDWIYIFTIKNFKLMMPVKDWIDIIQYAKTAHSTGMIGVFSNYNMFFKYDNSKHRELKRKNNFEQPTGQKQNFSFVRSNKHYNQTPPANNADDFRKFFYDESSMSEQEQEQPQQNKKLKQNNESPASKCEQLELQTEENRVQLSHAYHRKREMQTRIENKNRSIFQSHTTSRVQQRFESPHQAAHERQQSGSNFSTRATSAESRRNNNVGPTEHINDTRLVTHIERIERVAQVEQLQRVAPVAQLQRVAPVEQLLRATQNANSTDQVDQTNNIDTSDHSESNQHVETINNIDIDDMDLSEFDASDLGPPMITETRDGTVLRYLDDIVIYQKKQQH